MKVNEILFSINFILASKIIDPQLVFVAGSPPSLTQSFIPHLITASRGARRLHPHGDRQLLHRPHRLHNDLQLLHRPHRLHNDLQRLHAGLQHRPHRLHAGLQHRPHPLHSDALQRRLRSRRQRRPREKELFLKKYFLKRLMSK